MCNEYIMFEKYKIDKMRHNLARALHTTILVKDGSQYKGGQSYGQDCKMDRW